jgi:tetratricopeptide (TPR) repeat protein
MSFVFKAGDEGTYLLKFNKQDFIRDQNTNDYVQVIVQSPPEITGSAWNSATVMPDRVYAPLPPPESARQGTAAVPAASAGPVLPKTPAETAADAPVPRTEQPAQTAKTTPDAAAPVAAEIPAAASTREETAPDTAESYLVKAQEAYNAGRIPDALDMLGRFAAAYPGGSDEAYWLYGQALEANSPSRDVKRALDYYRRLVREYPHSGRYDAARRRIAYLQRFYFDIQ